jgi:hypothetical protein
MRRTFRFTGHCHRCRREDREVETRYDRGAQTLCDGCYAASQAPPPSRAPARTHEAEPSSAPTAPQCKPSASVVGVGVGQSPPKEVEGDASDMLAEINELVSGWLAGANDAELVRVNVRPLPADALPSEVAVARFAAIVNGLMLGVANRRPMLLARRWVAGWLADPRMARACGLERPIKQRTVGHCLDSLTAWGVLERVRSVRVRGWPRPAHLYELAAVDALDGRAEVAGPRREQPGGHPVDEQHVGRAHVGADDRDRLGAAVGGEAGGEVFVHGSSGHRGVGYAPNARPRDGGRASGKSPGSEAGDDDGSVEATA